MKKCTNINCSYEGLANDLFNNINNFDDKIEAINQIFACEHCKNVCFNLNECNKDERKKVILSLYESKALNIGKEIKTNKEEAFYIDKILSLIIFSLGIVIYLNDNSISWSSLFCFVLPPIYLLSKVVRGYKEIELRKMFDKLEKDKIITTPNWVKLNFAYIFNSKKESIGCLGGIGLVFLLIAFLNNFLYEKTGLIIWSILFVLFSILLLWNAFSILLIGTKNLIKVVMPFTNPTDNIISALFNLFVGYLIIFNLFIYNLSKDYQYFENTITPNFLDVIKYSGKLALDVVTFDFSNYFLTPLSNYIINQEMVIPKIFEFSFKFVVAIFLIELLYLMFTPNEINDQVLKRISNQREKKRLKKEKENNVKEEERQKEIEKENKIYWERISNLNIKTDPYFQKIKNKVSNKYRVAKSTVLSIGDYSNREPIFFKETNVVQISFEWFDAPIISFVNISPVNPPLYIEKNGLKTLLKNNDSRLVLQTIEILKMFEGKNPETFKKISKEEWTEIYPFEIRVYLHRLNSIECYQTTEIELYKQQIKSEVQNRILMLIANFKGIKYKEKKADNN